MSNLNVEWRFKYPTVHTRVSLQYVLYAASTTVIFNFVLQNQSAILLSVLGDLW